MNGGIRERILPVLREWKHFILLIVVLLFLPYSVQFPHVSSPFLLYLSGLFYDFQVLQLELTVYDTLSYISIINLILVAVPSAYFTFRYKNRIKDENIAILALITIALSLIVVTIVDYWGLKSPMQIDELATPTPNVQFLPSFVFLLLFFAVIVPLFKEYATETKRISISDYYKSGFRAWISTKLPKTTSGWLLAFILVAPVVVTIEFTTFIGEIRSTNIDISFLGSYFTLLLERTYSGIHSGFAFLFILGGYEAWYNLLAFQILGMWFSFSVVLYIQNKISRRLLIVSGLLSFVIPLFLSLFSFFSVILAIGTELIFPIPILQLLGILLIRRVDKLREVSSLYVPVKLGSDIVKVPIGYILTSLIKRIKRSKNHEVGESLVKRDESVNKEDTES